MKNLLNNAKLLLMQNWKPLLLTVAGIWLLARLSGQC